jgi:PhnB protein
MKQPSKPIFAPQLFIKSGIHNINFYIKALGAVEIMRVTNEDGSIHVAEFSINGAIFHVHEETARTQSYSPETNNGTTAIIGLFVDDVDAFMKSSIAAGAKEISPAQDYDYGYRQGKIRDPFGHIWMFEKKI